MHEEKNEAVLERSHFISFTITLLTHLTRHAANRQRMGLGGPTQTGGWHQLEAAREGRWGWESGERERGERGEEPRDRSTEREWWQSDGKTTHNRKHWGQVFSTLFDGRLRKRRDRWWDHFVFGLIWDFVCLTFYFVHNTMNFSQIEQDLSVFNRTKSYIYVKIKNIYLKQIFIT